MFVRHTLHFSTQSETCILRKIHKYKEYGGPIPNTHAYTEKRAQEPRMPRHTLMTPSLSGYRHANEHKCTGNSNKYGPIFMADRNARGPPFESEFSPCTQAYNRIVQDVYRSKSYLNMIFFQLTWRVRLQQGRKGATTWPPEYQLTLRRSRQHGRKQSPSFAKQPVHFHEKRRSLVPMRSGSRAVTGVRCANG